MKIELKKIQIFDAMSEETTAFVADVFIDGVKAAYAKNDGHGGNTHYHSYEGQAKLVEQAETFCAALPDKDYGDFKHKMSLEDFIDDLVFAEQLAKDKKKLEKKLAKKMVNSLMYGKKSLEGDYYEVSFKMPLDKIPLVQLQALVEKYTTKMKTEHKDFVIWNTNLEKLGVKL